MHLTTARMINVHSDSNHDQGPSPGYPASVPATPPSRMKSDTLPDYREKATQTRLAVQDKEATITARLYSSLEKPLEVLNGQGRIVKEQKAMILAQHRMIEEHQVMLREEQVTVRAQLGLIDQQRTQFLLLQKEHNALLEAIAKIGKPQGHSFQQQPRHTVPSVSRNHTKPRKRPVPPHVVVYINEVRDRLQAALNKAKADLHRHGGIDKARMIDLVHIQQSLTSKVEGAATSKERVEKDASFDADLLKTRLEPLESDISRGRRLLETISQRSFSRLKETGTVSTTRNPSPVAAETLVKQECDDDALATTPTTVQAREDSRPLGAQILVKRECDDTLAPTSTNIQDREIKQEPEDTSSDIVCLSDFSYVTAKRPGETLESGISKKLSLDV